jgi:hypothetical protein
MAYKRPDSVSDPSGGWNNDGNAIDGNTSSYAYSDGIDEWSDFLEFHLSSGMDCNKVRFWAGDSLDGTDLDIYYDGSWHDVFQGGITDNQWVEKELGGIYNVTRARIRFENDQEPGAVARINEFEFSEVTSGVVLVGTAMCLGDYRQDSTIFFCWSTYDKNGSSITRTTNGTIKVYRDDGTSECTAGITDTEDFDGLTGIHNCKIDLSADAFYSPGHDYSVVLEGAMIDGEIVNAQIASFSIENRSVDISLFEKAAKMLVNKAVQDKATGAIEYFDDDGQTVVLTHTPTDDESTITRTPS